MVVEGPRTRLRGTVDRGVLKEGEPFLSVVRSPFPGVPVNPSFTPKSKDCMVHFKFTMEGRNGFSTFLKDTSNLCLPTSFGSP